MAAVEEGSKRWSERETKELLTIMGEQNIVGLLDGKRTRSTELFKMVAAEMARKGYVKTYERIRTKFKYLKAKYFKVKGQIATSAERRLIEPYFNQMDALFSHRSLTSDENGIESPLGSGLDDDVDDLDRTDHIVDIRSEFAEGPPVETMPTPYVDSFSDDSYTDADPETLLERPQCERPPPVSMARRARKRRFTESELWNEQWRREMEFEKQCRMEANASLREIVSEMTNTFLSGMERLLTKLQPPTQFVPYVAYPAPPPPPPPQQPVAPTTQCNGLPP